MHLNIAAAALVTAAHDALIFARISLRQPDKAKRWHGKKARRQRDAEVSFWSMASRA